VFARFLSLPNGRGGNAAFSIFSSHSERNGAVAKKYPGETKMKNTIKAIILATLLMSLTQLVSAAPANDFWGDATLLTGPSGTVTGNLIGATLQTCEATMHEMADQGYVPASKTIWYKFQAPSSGSYTFSIDGTNTGFYAVLSAYKMLPGLCNNSVASVPFRIIENSLYNRDLGGGYYTQIKFRAAAGEVIHVAVDAASGDPGSFNLAWEKTRFHFDAQLDYKNGGADLVINRPSPTGMQWWTARFSFQPYFSKFAVQTFGYQDDKTFLADYDGDGISDMVVVRRHDGLSEWWISNMDGQLIKVLQFGLATDNPIVGDYDGDGIADIAVTRDNDAANTKVWHILRSSDGQYVGLQFGLSTDKEMVGDYDGDRKTDLVVTRKLNGKLTWYILRSGSNQVMTRVFGNSVGDIPQVVDFDGDHATDIAVFRSSPGSLEYSGYWFSLDSSSPMPLDQVPTRFQHFGQLNDQPQAADYDGDGLTDMAVYREGIWWVCKSRTGQVESHAFGKTWDLPLTDGGVMIAQRYYYQTF